MADEPVDQPTDFTMQKGFMLTVGVVVNSDRCACVFPFSYSETPDDENVIAASLVDAFQTNAVGPFCDLLSSDAYVSFLQAEGMRPGNVPFRLTYAQSDRPGTGSAGVMPSSVGGLLYWMEDQRDIGFTPKKIREGKCFVPGIPRDQVMGDVVITTWQTLGQVFTNMLQGFMSASTTLPSLKWWRVLSKPTSPPLPAPPDDSTPLKRVFVNGARGYVVTQRRRTIPR